MWFVESLFLLLGNHEALEVATVDLAGVDLELGEGVVHLLFAELVTPGHERVLEPKNYITIIKQILIHLEFITSQRQSCR